MSNPIGSHRLPGTRISSCQGRCHRLKQGSGFLNLPLHHVSFCLLILSIKHRLCSPHPALFSCLATFPVLPVSGDDCLGSQLHACLRADLNSGQCTGSSHLLSLAGGKASFVIRGAVQTHAHPPVGLLQNHDDNLC